MHAAQRILKQLLLLTSMLGHKHSCSICYLCFFSSGPQKCRSNLLINKVANEEVSGINVNDVFFLSRMSVQILLSLPCTVPTWFPLYSPRPFLGATQHSHLSDGVGSYGGDAGGRRQWQFRTLSAHREHFWVGQLFTRKFLACGEIC